MARSAWSAGARTPSQYFFKKRVFTIEEFLENHPGHTPKTARAFLAYYVKRGILWRMKRGLYQDTDSIDWIGVASRWAPDALIGYEAALWLHTPDSRRSLSRPNVAILTESECAPFWVGEERVIYPVLPAKQLGTQWRRDSCSIPWVAKGFVIATTFERTVVDLLDRMDLCPPLDPVWEEIAHQAPSATKMIDHALKLGNRTACARLGFILEHLPDTKPEDLARLPRLKSPAYFDERLRAEDQQQLSAQWNLMVPLTWATYVKQTEFNRGQPHFTEIQKGPQW